MDALPGKGRIHPTCGEVNMMQAVHRKLLDLIGGPSTREEGQDLVEYALVLALIGLGGFAGIEALARSILNLFIGIISVININLN